MPIEQLLGLRNGDPGLGKVLPHQSDHALPWSRRLYEAWVSSRAPPANHGESGRIGVNDGQEAERP